MKRITAVLFLLIFALTLHTYSQNQRKTKKPPLKVENDQDVAEDLDKPPKLPDYRNWKLIGEYQKPYVFMRKSVVLSSSLFQRGNEDICVYYYPGTNEPWLAVYQKGELIRSRVNKGKKPYKIWRIFFYESDRKEEGWIFVDEIFHFGEHLEIFKNKYSLEPISEEKPSN